MLVEFCSTDFLAPRREASSLTPTLHFITLYRINAVMVMRHFSSQLVPLFVLLMRNIQTSASSMDKSNGEGTIIGGGAINEKPRTYQSFQTSTHDDCTDTGSGSWNPEREVAHMLHAVVGLDRYPNYLSRFNNIADIEALENALEQELDEVKRQKNEIMNRKKGIRGLVCQYNTSIMKNKLDREQSEPEAISSDDEVGVMETCTNINDSVWCSELSPPRSWLELKKRNILHEDAFNVAFRSMKTGACRGHEIGDIINGKVDLDLNPSLLEHLMTQVMFDVYSFPLLDPQVSWQQILNCKCVDFYLKPTPECILCSSASFFVKQSGNYLICANQPPSSTI